MSTATAPNASAADVAAVQRCEQAYNRIRDELAKVIVGQDEVIEQVLVADLRPRSCPARRRARPGQDAARQLAGPGAASVVQANPVHARPDAERRDRHRSDPRKPANRRPGVQIPRRPAVRQHDPGRRNQPHAAEDAGRHARSDARAADRRPAGRFTSCPHRSSCWPRRIRSSKKAPIRCPKPSSTASCCTSRSIIRAGPRNGKSPAA